MNFYFPHSFSSVEKQQLTVWGSTGAYFSLRCLWSNKISISFEYSLQLSQMIQKVCTYQCLASCFPCQEISGIFDISCKILAIILGKVRKILQDFSRSWKEIQENFWTSWQENQDYPRSWQENQEKSWISCQENSWIFDICCQDLGNYSWQGSQDFARFFKIVERNPRKFLEFLATKARITKILARKPRRQALGCSTPFTEQKPEKVISLQLSVSFWNDW